MATYDFHLRCPIAQMIISFSCRSCLKAEQASCHARTLPINNISFFFLDRLLRTSGNLRPGGERGQLTIERQTVDLCRIALSTCGSLDVQYIVQHAAISKFLPVALKPTTNKKKLRLTNDVPLITASFQLERASFVLLGFTLFV